MSGISRRQFLQMAAAVAAGAALPLPAHARIADALQDLAAGNAPVVWLHGQACSGCSVSFLNVTYPDPVRVLTEYVSLAFHPTLSAATGDVAMQTLDQRIAAGGHVLIVEGSVPQRMPFACRVGERDFTALLTQAAKGASAIIALGTCATHGGIPSAPPNPTGAVSVAKFLSSAGISAPLINLPGCPIHPEWLLGTVVHLLKLGVPKLTPTGCPDMFYGTIIHERCPHFYEYEMGRFARTFGEPGCLFELGCMGIRTYADCSTRRWNGKVSWCVEAGAPCIGCARPEFVQQANFPLYRLSEREVSGEK